eukprot:9148647-Alexandrium_andersonii.AAC.1
MGDHRDEHVLFRGQRDPTERVGDALHPEPQDAKHRAGEVERGLPAHVKGGEVAQRLRVARAVE